MRYETHGREAHKHERWDDKGEGRHKHPNDWRGTRGALLDLAIQDQKGRFTEYEARYEAWMEKNEIG